MVRISLILQRVAAVLGVLLFEAAAQGLEIEFVELPSTTVAFGAAQRAALAEAARVWESRLVDPIVVRLQVTFGECRGGCLASTQSLTVTHDYTDVRQSLRLDATRDVERQAIERLPAFALPLVALGGSFTDEEVRLTRANARALGLGTGEDPEAGEIEAPSDGRILFDDTPDRFDYVRSDGVPAGRYDFVWTAVHEIGHALGFGSQSEVNDAIGFLGRALPPTPLDLWRFPLSDAAHDITGEPRWIRFGPAEYEDGVRSGPEFARGLRQVDPTGCPASLGTCEASHFRCNATHVMCPAIRNGRIRDPSPSDAHALNYIGWDDRGDLVAARFPDAPPDAFVAGFFTPPPYPDCLADGPGCWLEAFPPAFEARFAGFPDPPPDYEGLLPIDFTPNAALRLGWKFASGDGALRSAVGLAELRGPIEGLQIEPPVATDGSEAIVEPRASLPPALLRIAFISEQAAGPRLRFRDTLSTSGALLDPTLGQHGGYRVTGFLDGEGDGVIGDVDARLSLVLLAAEHGLPDLELGSVLEALPDDEGSHMLVSDAAAFGFDAAPCGDVDLDLDVDPDDVQRLREALADPQRPLDAEARARCSVTPNGDSCDLRDVTRLRRALRETPLGPGLGSACPAGEAS